MPVFSRIAATSPYYVPPELCDFIIDLADREDLSNLSVVARSWTARAQYRLFQELYVVAGPRCILWYTQQVGHEPVPAFKILPDSFQVQQAPLARLNPMLLGYVQTITFRGLSDHERRKALTWSMGYGDDPYITPCVVRSFLNLLPAVHTIHLSHVIWTSCLRSLLRPAHRCIRDSDKRDLQHVSATTVDHGRLHDSVFDVLEIARACRTLSITEVSWDHISLLTDQFTRLRRPDIRELTISFPADFVGTILARRLPRFEQLVALDIKNLSYATYRQVHQVLKKNARTLETLKMTLGDESLSEDMWNSLELQSCQAVKTLHLEMSICAHEPNEMCFGKRGLALLVSLLPRCVESISIVITQPTAPEEARQRIRTVPEWEILADDLRKISTMRSVTIDIPHAAPDMAYDDDPEDDPGFYAWNRQLKDLLKPIEVTFNTHRPNQ